MRIAAAFASVGFLAACGGSAEVGGESGPVDAAQAEGELPLELEEPSQAALLRAGQAIDLLGGFSGAFVGVLLAIDAGYNAEQVFDGIDIGGLQRDGTIVAVSGGSIAPEGVESGLIERATGGVEFIVFGAVSADLTDEEIDRLSDEELEREFDDVFGDLDVPTLEEVARGIELTVREEFPLAEDDLHVGILAAILDAIDEGVSRQELIFRAVTGRYSDAHLYSEAYRVCISSVPVVDNDGNFVRSGFDGCMDRRIPGLRERVEARANAATEDSPETATAGAAVGDESTSTTTGDIQEVPSEQGAAGIAFVDGVYEAPAIGGFGGPSVDGQIVWVEASVRVTISGSSARVELSSIDYQRVLVSGTLVESGGFCDIERRHLASATDPDISDGLISVSRFLTDSVSFERREGEGRFGCEHPSLVAHWAENPINANDGTEYDAEFQVVPASDGSAEGTYFGVWTFHFQNIAEVGS